MQKKTMDNRQGHNRISVGKALVQYLENRGVSVVFGIPGVHTLELYRGLEKANLRHITPRHEQGAGFMADGYARASGRLGVAFVITGPGVTNILTAMGQVLADSIPMLVVSSVNAADSLGKGLGHLHELPDQQGICKKLSLRSEHIHTARDLIPALHAIFKDLAISRPGPMHIQVPVDLLGQDAALPMEEPEITVPLLPAPKDISAAREKLAQAKRPVIIAGGGSISAADQVTILAEILKAPVVQTINARGQMHQHPLRIPASPSLQAVRHLLAASDAVLAVGTQLGPTDFDIYSRGDAPPLAHLIRVDIDPQQLERHPADIRLQGRAQDILPLLIQGLAPVTATGAWGENKAKAVCRAARTELPPGYGHMVEMVETIRDTLPGSIIVGDSTQPIYAANLYYGHDSPRGWFNAATGFGTLGYAIPAAIGACLADPGRRVVCITGDGGAQFTLPEMMTAKDENLPVVFLIWNNFGFKEIAGAMSHADIAPIGCHPRPPDFQDIARAHDMPYVRCHNTVTDLENTLKSHADSQLPVLIEIQIPLRGS
ncbi:MAG: 5-guanidino-2-oxopentanoate decarboxylase [Desulfotignum sp.]|nr:5-guanidino-2-oxopentanoate decarboxylase [Desulfotignum sp.]MCF8113037.1 5-guanidino-2-oxopentanoate decarboxylase [Desulfotignum sp.]MCF8124776.1 5-guanidino-2-oxopentanoate decarboxylase [Desulfotignum sp.]